MKDRVCELNEKIRKYGDYKGKGMTLVEVLAEAEEWMRDNGKSKEADELGMERKRVEKEMEKLK